MKSTNQPHLQPINFDEHPKDDAHSIFALFPLLPKELRVKIWRHAMERNRMFRLNLVPKREIMELRFPIDKPGPPNADALSLIERYESRFEVFVFGRQLLSKLLRVNRESRDEAMRLYRIHIPCTFVDKKNTETKSHTLYFNPDLDYDMDQMDPSNLNENVRTTLQNVLKGLREVLFLSTTMFGRQILSWRSAIGYNGYLYNRSFPIPAYIPTFKHFPVDPRAVGDDLRKTVVGNSDYDRRSIENWQKILVKFGISAPQIKYKLLLRQEPLDYGIVVDRKGAEQWIQKEKERWRTHSEGRDGDIAIEEMVRPAFGFWIFPLDAIDSPAVDQPSHVPMLDLSSYRPELGCAEF
ncbi:unnamed protein product [Periconia digitata]|uniref:2EXR domain-containing protein n=1 Tax=Periconia digitata TaxID=1303443 RepID=A0A9W4URU3_9PLEO|nr:unnamed protein product [Periconia digitata]